MHMFVHRSRHENIRISWFILPKASREQTEAMFFRPIALVWGQRKDIPQNILQCLWWAWISPLCRWFLGRWAWSTLITYHENESYLVVISNPTTNKGIWELRDSPMVGYTALTALPRVRSLAVSTPACAGGLISWVCSRQSSPLHAQVVSCVPTPWLVPKKKQIGIQAHAQHGRRLR